MAELETDVNRIPDHSLREVARDPSCDPMTALRIEEMLTNRFLDSLTARNNSQKSNEVTGGYFGGDR